MQWIDTGKQTGLRVWMEKERKKETDKQTKQVDVCIKKEKQLLCYTYIFAMILETSIIWEHVYTVG